jgi:multiple sugar transport system permease protein
MIAGRRANPFGRFVLYAVLVAGGVVMSVPFIWMVVTSFQSVQESLQSHPVWLPNRINPVHWSAASSLGVQGGDAVWGGVQPGRTVNLEIRTSGSVAPTVSVPQGGETSSSAFLFGSDAGATAEPAKRASVTKLEGDGLEGTRWQVRLENTGTAFELKMPLQVVLPDGERLLESTLPPDRVARSDAGEVFEWSNAAPGGLGYVLENYRDALVAAPFARYFLNSLVNAVAQVALGLIVVTLAAFAFAKIPFWGRDALFALLLSSLVIPGEMLLVPNFVTVFKLGWIDTYQGMVVPWIASVFGIFLLRQFFMSLPNELFEAARIDGAGYGTIFLRIALPLSVPGLVTFGIFSFLGSWNALIWPLIVTNAPEMKTLQNGLQSFISEAGSNYGQLMAASLLVVAPIILGFLLAQKQFIAGVARSGLK